MSSTADLANHLLHMLQCQSSTGGRGDSTPSQNLFPKIPWPADAIATGSIPIGARVDFHHTETRRQDQSEVLFADIDHVQHSRRPPSHDLAALQPHRRTNLRISFDHTHTLVRRTDFRVNATLLAKSAKKDTRNIKRDLQERGLLFEIVPKWGCFVDFDVALGLCNEWQLDGLRGKLEDLKRDYGQHIEEASENMTTGLLPQEISKLEFNHRCIYFLTEDHLIHLRSALRAADYDGRQLGNIIQNFNRWGWATKEKYISKGLGYSAGKYVDLPAVLKLCEHFGLDVLSNFLSSSLTLHKSFQQDFQNQRTPRVRHDPDNPDTETEQQPFPIQGDLADQDTEILQRFLPAQHNHPDGGIGSESISGPQLRYSTALATDTEEPRITNEQPDFFFTQPLYPFDSDFQPQQAPPLPDPEPELPINNFSPSQQFFTLSEDEFLAFYRQEHFESPTQRL